jgi:hypothetical protein
MLCEAFGRLYPFRPVEQYGYIGLGSIYFSDFQLLHRTLGISDLLSIERDRENEERFRCIDIKFGSSSEILPRIDWSRERIVWLDYDGGLGPDELADVGTFITKAESGSFLVLSVNAQPIAEPSDEEIKALEKRAGEPFKLTSFRLTKLMEVLGEKVPRSTDGRSLKMDGLPKTLRKIIVNEIEAQLSVRNELKVGGDRFVFRPVVNFVYKDGAQMLTFGGVLFQEKDLEKFNGCRFSELPYFREGEDVFAIRVPCLTPSEMRHLNAFLPTDNVSGITKRGIPDQDIQRYVELYRFFPNYGEVLIA